MGRDFYKILGVNKDFTEKELKKAYKNQARIWHPDKNPDNKEEAEEKFKEISEAYSVLSDPDKKRIYDLHGEEGLKQGGQMNINPEELFRNIFGNDAANGIPGFIFHHSVGGGHPNIFDMFTQHQNRNRKAPPIFYDLPVTLEELHAGKTKKMKITKNVNGQQEKKVLEIPIKRGMKAGCKFTFKNEGDQIPGIIPADMIFTLVEKPHKFFTRQNDDIIYILNISIDQALYGCEIMIPTIEDDTQKIKIDPLKCSMEEKILHNKGMFNSRTRHRGNFIIKFNVLFK